MFSIAKLLGQDQKFFDLLEASAQQADSSVHHLVALLTGSNSAIRRPASMSLSTAGGRVKRFGGVKWGLVERIVWAWVLTLPCTALLGYLLARLAHLAT